jgi:hypothetical protein
MLRAVTCPFCGGHMRDGLLRMRGLETMLWGWVSWEDAEIDARLQVLPPSFFPRPRRPARCCVNCLAVLVDPPATEPS